MRKLKYAGLCAAGFFLELGVSFGLAFLVFYMFVFSLLISIPTCILIGKAHFYISRKIRNELGLRPVVYFISAMALPVLVGVVGAFIGLAYPELLTGDIKNSISAGFAGFGRYIIVLGSALNTMITSSSGAYFIHKEHSK